MENRNLGIILIVVAIIIAGAIFAAKVYEDSLIQKMIEQQDTCFLADGTCLHDRNVIAYTIGWAVSAAIFALGLYLILFEKSQKAIISALNANEKKGDDETRFNLFLKALDPAEQSVIKAVKEQDGITQQTLRLRTGLHKSKLSITLDRLEKKSLVKRVEKGKTNQVFLKVSI